MADPNRKRKADEAFAKPVHSSINDDHPSRNGSSKHSSIRQKAETLLKTRQQLPIWAHAGEIRQKVQDNDVVLLVGETGSGKSTQIPQFLCAEEYCQPQHLRRKVQRNHVKSSKGRADVRRAVQEVQDVEFKGRIAILQPRRVAAISLATRVAAEVGTPLGSSSPASTVGYSVRFDNNVSTATKIKFLTDGMLLQELLRDPWLKEYSVVVVDEVHERGLNVDLTLGFLRRIIDAGKVGGDADGRSGNRLRVVVMSATADMSGINDFLTNENNAAPNGRTEKRKPANGHHVGKEEEWTGFSDDEKNDKIEASAKIPNSHVLSSNITVASCHIIGRQYPVTINYEPKPVENLLDIAMSKIMHIHQYTPLPGDVLVFLSGQEMIENLESLCQTYAQSLHEQQTPTQDHARPKASKTKEKLPALQILPLFASLPTNLQSRIFQPTPSFTRRIILSTNIAETSLTVPNIRHVIDTGKRKSRHFRPGLNLDTLLSQPISRSSAAQRSGRAGREAPGTCWRLYTQNDFYRLEADTQPEILQTDLSFLVLTLKAHSVDNVLDFPLLTRPPRRNLEAALEHLLNLDALDPETGKITDIGRKMSLLPLRADLARALLASTTQELDCTDEIIDIVAALSLEEGIFMPIHNKSSVGRTSAHNQKKSTRELLLSNTRNGRQANLAPEDDMDTNADSDSDSASSPQEEARRKLLSRHSDHLTLLNAIQAYTAPNTHDRRAWCDAHAISHRAMSRIMDVRKQLGQITSSTKFHLRDTSSSSSSTNVQKTVQLSDTEQNRNESTAPLQLADLDRRSRVLKALLAGLWPNVAILTSLATQQQRQSAGAANVNPNQRAPYTTLLTNQGIHVHPSSTMFVHRGTGGGSAKKEGDNSDKKRRKGAQGNSARDSGMARAVIFTDLIYTTKAYARNVSSIELAWVAEMGRLS